MLFFYIILGSSKGKAKEGGEPSQAWEGIDMCIESLQAYGP